MQPTRDTWSFLFALALGLSLTTLVGCGSTSEVQDDPVASGDTDVEVVEAETEWRDPEVGMTQEEIIALYGGEPDSKQTGSDGGEIWSYHMNAGQMWIPWNFGYRPEYDVINFSPDGKVTSFTLGR